MSSVYNRSVCMEGATMQKRNGRGRYIHQRRDLKLGLVLLADRNSEGNNAVIE